MRRLVALLVATSTAVAAVLLVAGPAEALSKVKCKTIAGMRKADPIVNHGMPGPSMHMHTFFGNAALLALPNPNSASYRNLMGAPTKCENVNDTAGYWTPTLYQRMTDGSLKPVPVAAFTAYYRAADGNDNGPAHAIPAGARLVAGMTTNKQINNWSCGQFSNAGPSLTFPDCSGGNGSPGQRLTAHITFPSCWDGVLPHHPPTQRGDTRDNRHFAYKLGNKVKGGACPAGFPIGVTELRETISYAYTGNGGNLVLASDAMMGGHHGSTLHADYFQSWVQRGFQDMVVKCINTRTGPAAYCDGSAAPRFATTSAATVTKSVAKAATGGTASVSGHHAHGRLHHGHRSARRHPAGHGTLRVHAG